MLVLLMLLLLFLCYFVLVVVIIVVIFYVVVVSSVPPKKKATVFIYILKCPSQAVVVELLIRYADSIFTPIELVDSVAGRDMLPLNS